jgi:hypothetical protein
VKCLTPHLVNRNAVIPAETKYSNVANTNRTPALVIRKPNPERSEWGSAGICCSALLRASHNASSERPKAENPKKRAAGAYAPDGQSVC